MLGQRLQEVVAGVVTGLGYELVGIEMIKGGQGGRTLRVYIDGPDGICLEDCERVSRQLDGVLDVEDVVRGAYTLEISSPGLDRPLFCLKHFGQFVGREAKVTLRQPVDQRRRFTAVIRAVTAEQIEFSEDSHSFTVPYALVDRARLVPEGGPPARPSPKRLGAGKQVAPASDKGAEAGAAVEITELR